MTIIETSGGRLKKNLWWRPAVLSFHYFLLTKAWLQMDSSIRGSECAGLDVGVPHRRFVKHMLRYSLSECTWAVYHWFWDLDFSYALDPKVSVSCLQSGGFFFLELLQLIHNVEKNCSVSAVCFPFTKWPTSCIYLITASFCFCDINRLLLLFFPFSRVFFPTAWCFGLDLLPYVMFLASSVRKGSERNDGQV